MSCQSPALPPILGNSINLKNFVSLPETDLVILNGIITKQTQSILMHRYDINHVLVKRNCRDTYILLR